MKILLVATGGALGSVLRYVLGGWIQTASGSLFPIGTMSINVLGCLVIGFLAALSPRESYRLFVMVGILGGFTTFSTFGLETFLRLNERQYSQAAANVLLSVVLGLLAVWLGYRLSEWLYGVRS